MGGASDETGEAGGRGSCFRESSQLEFQLLGSRPGRLTASKARGSERKEWKAGSRFHLATPGQDPDGQVFMSTSSQTEVTPSKKKKTEQNNM